MNASISANPPRSKAPDAGGLRIAGLTPYSSIDYPGCLSAVVWIQGCPWRCTYCHNPHLQSRTAPPQQHWDEVMAFLRKRVGLLDAVVFSGGEATTDRHLAAAMVEAKALGYKIGLHTAGCYPERLRQVLPLLDWVGLDIKTSWQNYADLVGVSSAAKSAAAALELVLQSGVAYEIRTTVHPDWLPAPELLTLGRGLKEVGVNNFAVQLYRSEGCSAQLMSPTDLTAYSGVACEHQLGCMFAQFQLRGG